MSSAKIHLLQIAQSSLFGTLFSCQWVPGSSRIAVTGSKPKGTGLLQVYELEDLQLKCTATEETLHCIKCAICQTDSHYGRRLVTGNAGGELQIWNVEEGIEAVTTCKAHEGMINSVSGCQDAEGSSEAGLEIATAGADGYVRIWDARLRQAAATFPPQSTSEECWTVGFGNAMASGHRQLLAGYSSGAVRLFDLAAGKERWSCNLGSGVTSAAFDRQDIEMNKFSAVCMNSTFHTFDARTLHSKKGFASCKKKVPGVSTLWGCQTSPDNREITAVFCGDGHLRLYQYHYPTRRRQEGKGGEEAEGVAGTTALLMDEQISDQPVSGFQWNAEKRGLFCCIALDQCLRVSMVTNMHVV